MPNRIKLHLVIAGFTQESEDWHGPALLREKICQVLRGKDISLNRVYLYEWHENWAKIAERLSWLRELHECQIDIGIYAYSWGAGWGAMQLAKQLKYQGETVEHMVLCDPVYRHPYILGNWRAFSNAPPLSWVMGHMDIKVPCNVREVFWYRQEENYPRSHNLVARNEKTVIHQPVTLRATHQLMDDRPEWHGCCLKQAVKL